MLVQNNSAAPVNLNLRDGNRYHIAAGRQITLPDSYVALLDDNASTIALFNTGVLTALTDAGAAFPGFPTTVNAADSKAGRAFGLNGLYDASGNPIVTGDGAAAVRAAIRYVTLSSSMTGEAVRNAIQASLDLGPGLVCLMGSNDGICTLGGPVICGSFQTLIIDQSLHLRWPTGKAEDANAQRALIENRCKTATRYDCTVTAVGRVATVTRNGHGKAVGAAIMIMGSATRGYNGAYRVESVPTANTFTVLLDYEPAASTAVPNTNFTSVKMCDADQQLNVVINGTLDGNGSTIPVTTNTPTMGVILSCAFNCWIRGSGRVVDMQGYTFTIAGFTHAGWDCENLYIWNPKRDGAHMQGPGRHGLIRGLRGYSHDDFTSLTTGDYAQFNEMTEGEFEDISVEDINCDVPDTGTAGAMFGKSYWWFSDINYRRVRGRCANALVALKRLVLASQYSLDKPVFVGSLNIEDCGVVNSTSQTNYVALLQATGDPTLKNVYIRNPSLGGLNTTNGCRLVVFNRTAADWTFDQLYIDGFRTNSQGASPYLTFMAGITGHKIAISNSAPFCNQYNTAFSIAGLTLKELLLDNCNPTFSGAGSGTMLSLGGGSTIDYVTVRNCTPVNSQNGAGNLVYWTTCALRVLTIDGCSFDGAQMVWGDATMDVTNSPTLKFTNCHTRGSTKVATLNKGVKILVDQQTEVKTTNVYEFKGASQVYTLIEGTLDSASVIPFLFTDGATLNLTSPNRKVAVDTAGLNRFTGGALYNTNAAAGTLGAAGPVVCQGTAANSWKLQGNPALAY